MTMRDFPPTAPLASSDVIAFLAKKIGPKAVKSLVGRGVGGEDAEDLVQEALESLFEEIKKGKEITNVVGYFWTCCRNALRNFLKHRTRFPIAPGCSLDEQPDVRPPCEAIEAWIPRVGVKIRQAAEQLLPRKRADARKSYEAVFRFAFPHFFAGMTYEQISKESGIHQDTVRRAFLELRQFLRSCLREDREDWFALSPA